jgi:hypothetical protein
LLVSNNYRIFASIKNNLKMTDKDKELLIKEKIQEVLDKNDYIFENREDFVKSRTNWDRLADIAEDFYDALKSINDIL